MALYVVGFQFDDGSFFNSEMSEEEYGLLNGENGLFYCQAIVALRARQAELQLTSNMVQQVRDGGFPAAKQLNTLYSRQQISSPSPTKSPEPEPVEEDTETSSTLGISKVEVQWSHAAVLLLIETWRQRREAFEDYGVKKMHVWAKIAQIMQSKGHKFTRDQCDKKWRALKGRYKSIVVNSKVGSGRRRWEFFSYMEEALAGHPSFQLELRASSSHGVAGNEELVPNESLGAIQAAPPAPCTSANNTTVEATSPSRTRESPEIESPPWIKMLAENQLKELRDIKEIMREKNKILRAICDKI